MKKHLFVFCVFSYVSLQAQVTFCPPGAKWNYLFTEVYPYSWDATVNMSIDYIKDSVVDGEQIKILWSWRFFMEKDNWPTTGATWIKQSVDTIFMRNKWTHGNWQILYNFAAQAGQSWTNLLSAGGSSVTSKTVVDSIGNKVIGGINHKVLFVTYFSTYQQSDSLYFYRQGTITERIGGDMYLFNYRGNYSSHIHSIKEFLCYKDDEIGQIQFTSKACDYSNPVGIMKHLENSGFKVYPNPADDIVNIESDLSVVEIIISDLNGRIVKQETLNNQEINTSDLIPAMYFLQVRRDKKIVYKTKIVKD